LQQYLWIAAVLLDLQAGVAWRQCILASPHFTNAKGQARMLMDLQEERAFVDASIKPGLAFSIVETARILRRNPLWVRELLDSGQIRFIKLGHRRMVPRSVLLDLLTKGM
jgi:hypothetical protein